MRAAASPHLSTRAGRGAAHGTCGELIQGVLPGGRAFHVTCPIDIGSEVAVRLSPSETTRVVGLPGWATTTARAVRQAAELLELEPVRIEVERTSALPRARGMASSTADVVAAARAVAAAAGQALDGAALAQLATSIEASDGVMHDGVVALGQHDGALLHRWPWSPGFTIAVFIPRQRRVTAETSFGGSAALAGQYRTLLADVDAAMRRRDAAAVASLASRSAELNQPFVPNPLLRRVRTAAAALGAAGVCVGHSGTVCGLLFAPTAGDDARQLAGEAVDRLLPTLPTGTDALVTRMAG